MRDEPDILRDFASQDIEQLIAEVATLGTRLLEVEDEHAGELARLRGAQRASARNLLHYLALRSDDIRPLQERLAGLGLSSLGRAEAHVLGNIHALLRVLYALAGRTEPAPFADAELPEFGAGHLLLETRTRTLLGPDPERRTVRVMVTMPSEAARNYEFVRDCVANGMDCMRINCAHDDAASWERMIVHLRRAEREQGRSCRVLMDLAGPKLRTGAIHPGPGVVHWKPQRDALGRVQAPARIWLTPWQGEEPAPESVTATLRVPQHWLERCAPGDVVEFEDARGATRSLRLVNACSRSFMAESRHASYVVTETELRIRRRHGSGDRTTVREVPQHPGAILLQAGDPLVLVGEPIAGTGVERDTDGRVLHPATVSCTLPEAFVSTRPGERIWMDDGKIGGVIRRVEPGKIHVEITHAKAGGSKLHPDRGINLPDTDMQLPALTNKDLADLPFVALHADMVALSFVQCPEDVYELQSRLRALGGERRGIVLKIETGKAFERLPELLLAALRSESVGVMIARGDLAVECGWERLAELQEEILWICEAAHVPAVWATQVLESLAKSGLPSRAEITDAAMGVRAECVMLNKGPHVGEAIRVLDGIMRRMQAHQRKKSPRLRRLRSWTAFGRGGDARRAQPLGGAAGSPSGAGVTAAPPSGTSSMLPSNS